MNKCHICGRVLDNPSDPLSTDCGGDCLHCMISVEASLEQWTTVINLTSKMLTNSVDQLVKDTQ